VRTLRTPIRLDTRSTVASAPRPSPAYVRHTSIGSVGAPCMDRATFAQTLCIRCL
ncbi:MAG: hypothetical protein AVDCRST_MAG68-619, partial [uncultured Gemmatimonadetes bacterium]